MKRVFVSILLLAALAIPAAAQSGPRVPPDNDDFSNAMLYSPDATLVTGDVQDATVEVGEPEHTCTTSASDYSVWFGGLLTPGTITIDTTGSEYVDGLTTSSNTVVSFYRETGSMGSIEDNLESLACSDGTGAGIITNAVVPALGYYYIQVSASHGVVANDPSEVQVKVTFTPSDPLSNDEPDGAKTLKLPNLLAVNGLFRATLSHDEPLDSAVPGPLTNTAWYKFTFTDQRIFFLQTASIGVFGSADLWFSLFTKSGSVYTQVSALLDQGENYIAAYLPAGTYFLRVGVVNAPYGGAGVAETVLALLYLVPPNLSFQTDSGTPDITGWTVKNAVGDGVLCDAPFDCYFKFVSSGATEATKLQANLNLSDVKIKPSDFIYVAPDLDFTVGDPNLNLSVKLIDAAGGKQKYSVTIDSPGSIPGLLDFAPGSIKPVKSKVIVKNKDTDSGDEVRVYSLTAIIIRTGEGRSVPDLSKLPLFGTIPSAWQIQSSSPKNVLPVPPAP